MKKLTVMVSCYNSGEWLRNRLTNLLQSTVKQDMEIWCVNANSPDERDHTIPQSFPVKYVKLDERNTVYETWNYIIQNSNSEFVTNANTDDLISPNGYEELMKVLRRGFDFAYPSWYVTTVPNQEWSALKDYDKNGHPGNYNGDLSKGGVGHFPMWRRALHSKCGYFDPQLRALSDADFWARCYYIGKAKFKWIPQHYGCYLHKNGENLWQREINANEWEYYHTKVNQYRSA